MIAYQDQAKLDTATQACLRSNIRVLQLYQCGSESSHVEYLLRLMNPPEHACIIDVGCGVGEVARLMGSLRPDLGFLLLNLNAMQLSLCPEGFTTIQADMHDMPVLDVVADVVMVNFTLGYADIGVFMAEAARVLKPGGILFIYDLARKGEPDTEPSALMRQYFEYSVYAPRIVVDAAKRAGLDLSGWYGLEGAATRDHLDPMLDDEYRAVCAQMDEDVMPIAWRFVKQ